MAFNKEKEIRNLLEKFMIDTVVYLNQILLPVALFVLVFASFYTETYLVTNTNSSLVERANDLDNFYEAIDRDSNLFSQFDSIVDSENYLEKLVNLGSSFGYNFTTSDISRSITQNKVNFSSNYICLPCGCWKISSL